MTKAEKMTSHDVEKQTELSMNDFISQLKEDILAVGGSFTFEDEFDGDGIYRFWLTADGGICSDGYYLHIDAEYYEIMYYNFTLDLHGGDLEINSSFYFRPTLASSKKIANVFIAIDKHLKEGGTTWITAGWLWNSMQ